MVICGRVTSKGWPLSTIKHKYSGINVIKKKSALTRVRDFFSLSPCGSISFPGLTLRRYHLGYSSEHFNLPHLYHCMYVTSNK